MVKAMRLTTLTVVALGILLNSVFGQDKSTTGAAGRIPTRVGEILELLKATGGEPIILKGEDKQRWVIVSPKLVGRVMAMSFAGKEGQTSAFIHVPQLKKGFCYRGKGDWNNFGGCERIWFTPEGGKQAYFFLPGEVQNWDNYFIPAAAQEQQYGEISKSSDGRSVSFAAPIAMTNYQGNKVQLKVTRQISVLDDCPFTVGMAGPIKLVGYESKTWAKNTGAKKLTKEETPFGIWTPGIFNSGPHTVALMPYRQGSDAELGPPATTEYFRYFLTGDKMPADHWSVKDGCVMLKTDGKVKSKVAVLRRRALGRLASLNLDNMTITLVDFKIYPEMLYPASFNLPYNGDPLDGDMLSVFMNEGEPGNAAAPAIHELEPCSPLLELAPGEQFCHVSNTWQIKADEKVMDELLRRFFNTNLAAVRQFDQAAAH